MEVPTVRYAMWILRQTHVYNGVQLYRGYVSVKGGTMAHIQLIYGDEPQLIEEEKRKF